MLAFGCAVLHARSVSSRSAMHCSIQVYLPVLLPDLALDCNGLWRTVQDLSHCMVGLFCYIYPTAGLYWTVIRRTPSPPLLEGGLRTHYAVGSIGSGPLRL